jgi:hypothetical protein
MPKKVKRLNKHLKLKSAEPYSQLHCPYCSRHVNRTEHSLKENYKIIGFRNSMQM